MRHRYHAIIEAMKEKAGSHRIIWGGERIPLCVLHKYSLFPQGKTVRLFPQGKTVRVRKTIRILHQCSTLISYFIRINLLRK